MQVEEPIDIFLSHDWPVGITDYGNWKQLVKFKPFFEKEVAKNISIRSAYLTTNKSACIVILYII